MSYNITTLLLNSPFTDEYQYTAECIQLTRQGITLVSVPAWHSSNLAGHRLVSVQAWRSYNLAGHRLVSVLAWLYSNLAGHRLLSVLAQHCSNLAGPGSGPDLPFIRLGTFQLDPKTVDFRLHKARRLTAGGPYTDKIITLLPVLLDYGP